MFLKSTKKNLKLFSKSYPLGAKKSKKLFFENCIMGEPNVLFQFFVLRKPKASFESCFQAEAKLLGELVFQDGIKARG